MRIAIIGGAGRVGATAAFALQALGLGREIVLVDVMTEAAEGEALDLRHGAAGAPAAQRFASGGMDLAAGADLVLVTAGLRRKPDETRLQLIGRNTALFKDILAGLRAVHLAPGALLLVVTNPVDILTHLATTTSGLPTERVIGLGTVLDTLRFRSLLAERLGVDPTQVDALILGEHGDSMVPIWSSATVAGVPLASLTDADPAGLQEVFEQTRKAGAEVIRLKGGAGYAVALAVAQVVAAIARDAHALLPVSTLQRGALGIGDICLSLPTVIGRAGVERVIEPAVNDDEAAALRKSAEVLKATLAEVGP
jgi:L-lactate dehydrogenase